MHLSNHSILQIDRSERSHGENAVCICEDITLQILLSFVNSVFNYLIAYIRRHNIVICITYRSPDASDQIGKFGDCHIRIKEILMKHKHHVSVYFMHDSKFLDLKWPEALLCSQERLIANKHYSTSKILYSWIKLYSVKQR